MTSESSAATHSGASLRQLDWRFLLIGGGQPFEHLAWIDAAPEALERCVEIGLARTASSRASDKADAIVVPEGARAPLHRAEWMYREVRKGTPTCSPEAVRAELFWRAPGAHGASALLPLGSPCPVAWYAGAPADPLDSRSRLRAITATRLTLRGLQRLRDFVAPEHARVVAPRSLSDRLSSLVDTPVSSWAILTPGTRDTSSVVFLPFRRGEREPFAVFKTARSMHHVWRLQREQAVLREARACVTRELQDSIPEPYGVARLGGHTFFIQSRCGGRSLAHLASDRLRPVQRKIADLRLAARWLTAFHSQAHVSGESRVSESLSRFEAAFGLRADDERLFAMSRRAAGRLAATPVSLVWQHNDFDPWNVHRDGDRLGVFDWERGAPGLPLMDLLYFATIWTGLAQREASRAAQARAFERLYLDPADADPLRRAVRACIREYMQALGLEPAWLPLLLVTTVLERALDRGDEPRGDNRQLAYLGALAAKADYVFSEEFARSWAAI